MTSAVVFAYHEVGVRCLQVLADAGVDVRLVVTHADAPGETIWFGSVAERARRLGLCVVMPASPVEALDAVRTAAPDFLFSFYYRHMLPAAFLEMPRRGAFNLHGSLLPKYRGRVPINWAVLHGETETGATLHRMVAKPDAGAIVDQQAVHIGPDDTAHEVFGRVVGAAETVLRRALPALIAGTARETPMDLKQGSYFGGRKPEDGRIDWRWPAARVHNLVRAVAPPYPGAFSDLSGERLVVQRTARTGECSAGAPALLTRQNALLARCGDGVLLQIVAAEMAGTPIDAAALQARWGDREVPLTDS
ncbi:MAG TPA: formyltransferase [Candidatus Binatia bacterium]|nr:formyltransferase [Candidatus Binatia bacterium]